MGFSKKILVPVDFTKVSDIAIEHALLMGKTIAANIHLIHIVDNKKHVQERTIRQHGYNRIVVPLDLHKETKQKLSAVRDVAKYFNSKVYLISPNETDEFLKNQLDRNLNYAVDYLTSLEIPVEVEISETKSEGSFVKSLLKYSASVEADLICIMNFYESSILNVFNSSYEQHVITNDAQIPVLCVNPVDTYVADRSSLAS